MTNIHGEAGSAEKAPATVPLIPIPIGEDLKLVGDYEFRAPRHGDLVSCPYCDEGADCDHCGGKGVLFASEVFDRAEAV